MNTFGPYSPIVKTGDLYFVSGQVGVDPQTGSAPADVESQTSQAMCNMQDALKRYELDMENIVKTTIYVTNMADFSAVNEIYQGFFADPKPARATVAVKELPRVTSNPILVEIEAVAAKSKRVDSTARNTKSKK